MAGTVATVSGRLAAMMKQQLSTAEHVFYLSVIAIGRLAQFALIGFVIYLLVYGV